MKSKILAPEVEALIPDGVDKFIPRCVVCTAEVPDKRRTSRSKFTCSTPCHTVFALYKKALLISRKCIACYHPSTPEQREEFREWRKQRGDLKRKKGRPVTEPDSPTFPEKAVDTQIGIR